MIDESAFCVLGSIAEKGRDEASKKFLDDLSGFVDRAIDFFGYISVSNWVAEDELAFRFTECLGAADGILDAYHQTIEAHAKLKGFHNICAATALRMSIDVMSASMANAIAIAEAPGAYGSISHQRKAFDAAIKLRIDLMDICAALYCELHTLRLKLDAKRTEIYEWQDQESHFRRVKLLAQEKVELKSAMPPTAPREKARTLEPSEIDLSLWTGDKGEDERQRWLHYRTAKSSISLNEDEHRILLELAKTAKGSHLAFRASIVILCAAGLSSTVVADVLKSTLVTASIWRNAYLRSQQAIRMAKFQWIKFSICNALKDQRPNATENPE
jgi:hypothetical protein